MRYACMEVESKTGITEKQRARINTSLHRRRRRNGSATCDLWALIYVYHYAEEWIAYLNMSMPSAAIRIHAC